MKKSVVLFVLLAGLCFSAFQCEELEPREIVDNNCIDESKINSVRFCYDVYQPVCGCDGKTYGNDCYAKVNGVLNFTEGECK
ncbi:Kazal-type serine protease inhibitor family protein [Arthrospiribacter ruber]|uniref:Kazal-type serine protease inhibitor family protein n=1 Tax=Arthrospiribacter ruber TaxID=2487934 RepID=A0A951IUV8_9BACT|nr:Kazal-type serine protease inhibitor family protein [Arthrospiribacter ruber]MBW3467595.1 Kazal-type serine protease inhibitor family protein [Arthrospiribacter ruber]